MGHVAIIGGGNLGSALADILSGGPEVRIWDKDPAKSSPDMTLEKAAAGASHVFFCLPSWVLVKALSEAAPFLAPDAVAIGMSKGMEGEKHRTIDEILGDSLPQGRSWAIVSGPMLAAELSAGQAGAAVVASPDERARESTAALLRGRRLAVELSHDPRGVALCGVLKNVYSLGLGIAAALEWPDNLRGLYVSWAVRECVIVLTALGGEGATVLGPAGLGDLVATGFSPHSRNRRYGEEIVKNGSCPFESEGCASLPHLLARIGDLRGQLVALDAVARVAVEHEKAAVAFGGLLS